MSNSNLSDSNFSYISVANPLILKDSVCYPHLNNTVQKTNHQDPLQAGVQAATRIELPPTAPTVIPTIQADAVALGFARSAPKLRSHQPHTPPLPFVDRTKIGKGRLIAEFAASGISSAMTRLNAQWLDGDAAIESLCEDAIAKVQSNTSYLTEPAKRIRDRCEYIAAGGWFAYGTTLDGTPGLVAYVKPDEPKLVDFGKKRAKYVTPEGCPALPLLPYVDEVCAERIFKRFKIVPLEGETFWQAILRSNCPVGIVEGLKKTLKVVEQGIPAIALRGFTQWAKKGGNELHDALAQFATRGRKVYVFFDEDAKPKTLEQAHKQRLKLGAALEIKGCRVFLPRWDTALGKGIDDVLVGLGAGAQAWFDDLIKTALTLKETRYDERVMAATKIIKKLSTLSYPVERATDGKYMPELPPIEKGAIYVLRADMESGKTTRIGQDYVKPWIAAGGIVVIFAPSNSLGKQTAENLGLPHIHDFDKTAEGMRLLYAQMNYAGGGVMCPDSQHRLPPWLFDRPLLLVWDEGNQVGNHMAEGNTLKERFSETWENFAAIAKNAIANGAIVLSEANLPDRAIKLVMDVSGATNVRVFTHEKIGVPWSVEVFKGQVSGYRAMFLKAVESGKKLIFLTTSQKEAERIEFILSDRHPDLKVFRVDSETNREGHFDDLFRKPNEWLQTEQPDVLLLSPSAKSGVDIEGNVTAADAYFDEVWGYFPSLATDSHMQLLGRYRPPVPRVIFCPKLIRGNPNEQAAYPSAIARQMRSHAALVRGVYGLDEILEADGDRAQEMLKIEQAVAEYLSAERSVAGCQQLMAHIELVRQLEAAGHNVTSKDAVKDDKAVEVWKAATEALERKAGAFMAERVVQEEHTPEWAKKRLQSMGCTLAVEVLAKKVLLRAEFPGVAFDDPDDCYRALYQDFSGMKRSVIDEGNSTNLLAAAQIDRELALTILSQSIKANHRLPRAAMRAKIFAASGILELVGGGEYQNSDKRAIAVKVNCLRFRKEIATYLSLHFNEGQTPVEICNRLVKRLGLKAVSTSRPGPRGQTNDRVYQVTGHDDPLRVRLLEAYKKGLEERVSVISNKQSYIQTEDTDQSPPPESRGGDNPEYLRDVKWWHENIDLCPENRENLKSVPADILKKAIAS